MTDISFAIPFRDRVDRLKLVISSIVNVCTSENIADWEIVLSSNCSTSASLQELKKFIDVDLFGFSDRFKLHSFDKLISLPENWLYSLSLCSGRILNIRRSSDLLVQFDVSILHLLSGSSALDYVVTPVYISSETFPVPNESYIRSVNSARRALSHKLSSQEKFDLLFSGSNKLGDLGGLYFKSHCIAQLKLPIDMYNPAFISWPDHEIYIRVVLAFTGTYHDYPTTEVLYRPDSGTLRKSRDNQFYNHSYKYPEVINTLLPFFPQYRYLFEELTVLARVKYLSKSITRILGYTIDSKYAPLVYLLSQLLFVKSAAIYYLRRLRQLLSSQRL